MSLANGRIWPYAIGISIMLVFSACIVTVVVANTLPVENSDTYMMGYHEADAKANELIQAKIAFDEKYKIEYITDALHVEGSTIKYRVTDVNSQPVNSAKIKVIVTRPNNHKHDQELINPSVENGIYTFNTIKLPQEGRWDIMAKANVLDVQRFYNVKADTRAKEAFEY
ncbi:FixH family protein [Candidatus Sulfurimonas marisnigri]|uniref:FixH family protein n=1 Tax=Candidatus Sulfurimonas marisnigri TaxID=2740405 RepID=A0A7S7RQI0_9BACT|nr:FixH family protein [Candidatus Sulfurimonas marisnigri]QOY54495.1 FixH family protein [Candidatus Sulfurimonas marisnigri]